MNILLNVTLPTAFKKIKNPNLKIKIMLPEHPDFIESKIGRNNDKQRSKDSY